MQALSRRHRAWLALLQVILLLAAIAMPAAASTTSDLATGQKWLELLQAYNIVRGDERGNLNLDQPIKRAEITAIMVRALNAEQDAKMFRGLSPFSDTNNHWANAEIAYAAIQKLVKGDGNGTFRPDDYITYAEALTLILRLVGKEPTTGEWPYNILLAAGQYHIAPPGITAENIRAQAVRGLVFQSMAKALVEVTDAEGRNVLQQHIDKQPPTLVVNVPEKTEAGAVAVSGTVEGAVGVSVNGQAVALSGNTFSTQLSVNYGTTTVTVEAWDWANNRATYTAKVTREFPVATLNITGPDKVAPGDQATYTITALDKDGKAVSPDLLTVKADSALGTFNKATGVLTVANAPGTTGKITVSAGDVSKSITVSIMGQAAAAQGLAIQPTAVVAYTKPMEVTVQVIDASGNLVTSDYARPVSLKASGLDGVTVSPATAYTEAGVATFKVTATKMGEVTLLASSTGLDADTMTATFGSKNRIRLVADPDTISVGGASSSVRVRAELVNEDGKVVANDTGDFIGLEIATTSDVGVITDSSLTINKGLTTSTQSGNDGMFALSGTEGGTATITGRITTGQTMTVEPAQVTVTVPKVGAGTKLQAVSGQVLLEAGSTAVFAIRLVDANGNFIPTGNYAFQVKVETSNNDPENVSVSLGDSGLNPVSDGIAEGKSDDGDDIIARTTAGAATLRVTYNKPGRVTITPIVMGATSLSYDVNGEEGAAISSTGFSVDSGSIVFQKEVAGVKITANSNLGENQPAAAITNSTSSFTTLTVWTVDSDGNWVPGQSRTVKLERVTAGDSEQNTTITSATTTNTVDGKATFTIKGTSKPGKDTYKATLGSYTATIDVFVDNAKPETPSIASTRGYKGSSPGSLNEVGPDEDGLEIVLYPGATQWAVAKVYVEGSSSPIYTSEAIDFSSSDARILVPKAKLPAGIKRYVVALKNGYGESAKSEYSDSVVNAKYNDRIYITSAKYDAPNRRLYVSGSGFSTSTTSPDTVDPSRLYLKDLSVNGEPLYLTGAQVYITATNAFYLDLTTWQAADLNDPGLFGGNDVRLYAESGWYTQYNGQTAAADMTDNKVTPFARVNYAVLDRSNKRLSVFGEGFTTGTLDFGKFMLTYSDAPDADVFQLKNMSPSRRNDTQIDFTLSSAALAKLDAGLPYQVAITGDGWVKDGSALAPAPAGNLTIYAKIGVERVSYSKDATTGTITITGSGFDFAPSAVTLADMWVYDVSLKATLSLGTPDVEVVSVSPTKIEIRLTGAAKATFESFHGSDIYLRAAAGWTENAVSRPAAAIGDYDLRFPNQ